MSKAGLVSSYILMKYPVSRILAIICTGIGLVYISNGIDLSSRLNRPESLAGGSLFVSTFMGHATNLILYGIGMILIGLFFAIFAASRKVIQAVNSNIESDN